MDVVFTTKTKVWGRCLRRKEKLYKWKENWQKWNFVRKIVLLCSFRISAQQLLTEMYGSMCASVSSPGVLNMHPVLVSGCVCSMCKNTLWILIQLLAVGSGYFPWRRRVLPLGLFLFSLFCCILRSQENNDTSESINDNTGKQNWRYQLPETMKLAAMWHFTFLSHCWWRYRSKMFVFSVTMTEEKQHLWDKNEQH